MSGSRAVPRTLRATDAALVGGLLGAGLTVPMNLLSGQGIQQALINGSLAGVAGALGSGVGYAAGGTGTPVVLGTSAGMLAGNLMGNQFGLDRNERGFETLGQLYNDEIKLRQIMEANGALDLAMAKEAISMLPETKRNQLLELAAPRVAETEQVTSQLFGEMTPVEQLPTERELRMAQALLDNAIATGAVQVYQG